MLSCLFIFVSCSNLGPFSKKERKPAQIKKQNTCSKLVTQFQDKDPSLKRKFKTLEHLDKYMQSHTSQSEPNLKFSIIYDWLSQDKIVLNKLELQDFIEESENFAIVKGKRELEISYSNFESKKIAETKKRNKSKTKRKKESLRYIDELMQSHTSQVNHSLDFEFVYKRLKGDGVVTNRSELDSFIKENSTFEVFEENSNFFIKYGHDSIHGKKSTKSKVNSDDVLDIVDESLQSYSTLETKTLLNWVNEDGLKISADELKQIIQNSTYFKTILKNGVEYIEYK